MINQVKKVRVTGTYETSDLEKLKEALFSLQRIGVIDSPTIHKISDSNGYGIFDFKMEFERLEYPNKDNTKLVVVE